VKRFFYYCSLVVLGYLISGCAATSFGFRDAQGWRDSQQKDFEAVLATDRYSSLCGLEDLYQQYLQSKDTKILTKLLVGYTQNLANSCIDIRAFKALERSKQQKKIHTSFTFYTQDASASKIISQLQNGAPIDKILGQYIPKNPQFKRLLAKLKQGELSPANRKKVKMSLERSKVMSDSGWDTYFLVNVPEFMVYFVENGKTSFSFPVVVGKKAWQTPIFDAKMKYVVLNPTWNVPDNIARSEEIPKLLRNKNRLKQKNMIVLKSYDTSQKPINPNKINWKKYLSPEYQKKALPYKIIQLPSKYNALGRVKFMFPNKHSVYMHDTNAKYLFKKSYRAYSHGCIRLSKPMMMLEYLANRGYLVTDKAGVDKFLASKEQKYVNLSRHIPVHIGYFTAYVKDDGSIKYSPDVYGFDSSMKFKKGF
jgi:murein L,D-transpeptidase YcbB/YkuD